MTSAPQEPTDGRVGFASAEESGDGDFPHAQQGQGESKYDARDHHVKRLILELISPIQTGECGKARQNDEYEDQPQRIPDIEHKNSGPALASLLHKGHDFQADDGKYAWHYVENQTAEKTAADVQ